MAIWMASHNVARGNMSDIDCTKVASRYLVFFVKGVTILEDEFALENMIRQLHQQMIKAYEEKGNLTDSCVIALSQELDIHIVRAQRLKSNEKAEEDAHGKLR